jgi:asparagine synthase (glutamine-hydrolysing)
MCGIIGGIGLKNWDETKILNYISHRGPDSKGSYKNDKIFLGHTRLSIQDLSKNGNQPMFSEDGRYVIIFNGEIYNHIEIREQFKNEFNFKSTGDTETVLYAYIKYGPSFLKKINGIFAIAIYDIHKKELFIARDKFGVKPFYIYEDDNKFLFSSEIKTFLAFDIDKSLDPRAFNNYLSFLWSPGEIVPLEKVRKLLPGNYIKLNVSNFHNVAPIPYFNLDFNGKYSMLSEKELIDKLEIKIVSAVKKQLLSDVPVGFFLSGGLDSSLIVAIAKKLFPESKFPCFTINVESEKEGNENFSNDLFYAKKVAELLDLELNIVEADIDIIQSFDKMIWHLDEPQADAAALNVLYIAQMARKKGIKVLLGGTGGDDIFSGYRRHQAIYLEKYFKYIPKLIRLILKKIVLIIPNINTFTRRLHKIVENLNQSTKERMVGYYNWLPNNTIHSLFSDKWQEKLKNYNPNSYLLNMINEIPKEKNLLNKMLFLELRTFLVDHNLNYTDKMAMAKGVEVRVPFLDAELVEFSLSIQPELKMKNRTTKYILKKVAERYLPDEIIYRSKTGFGAPIRKWVTFDMEEMIKERLSLENVQRKGIFNHKKIWDLIRDNKINRTDGAYSIWAILAIDSWMNQFLNDYSNEI